MISQNVLTAQVISVIISILGPLALLIYIKKTGRVLSKTIMGGFFSFVVFAMFLEQLAHIVVFKLFPGITGNAFAYTLYGAFAAGIFEEVGKYLSVKIYIKKEHTWNSGALLGLGHGGTETLWIGAFYGVQNFLMMRAINAGTFMEKYAAGASAEMADSVMSQMKSLTAPLLIVGGIERLLAFVIQVALSIIIVLGFARGKKYYVFYAILLHALVDIPVALYQAIHYPVFIVYIYLIIVSAIALYFIFKSRKMFCCEAESKEISS